MSLPGIATGAEPLPNKPVTLKLKNNNNIIVFKAVGHYTNWTIHSREKYSVMSRWIKQEKTDNSKRIRKEQHCQAGTWNWKDKTNRLARWLQNTAKSSCQSIEQWQTHLRAWNGGSTNHGKPGKSEPI